MKLGDAVEEIDLQKMFSCALFMEAKDIVMKDSHEDFSNDVAENVSGWKVYPIYV